MRWMNLAVVLTALIVCLPGCGAGGPETGVPTDIPAGPPPVPPGTSKEMMKGSSATKLPPRPPV